MYETITGYDYNFLNRVQHVRRSSRYLCVLPPTPWPPDKSDRVLNIDTNIIIIIMSMDTV